MTIAQEELKKLLHYDPDTGVFTWITERQAIKKGSVAGCVKSTNGTRQVVIEINGKKYQARRLAFLYMEGSFPDKNIIIKNIDGDTLDSRWNNLYKTTISTQVKLSNRSGVVGVYWHAPSKNWRSQIRINGKKTHIGYYDTIFEAACARKSAELKYGLKA